MPSDLFKKLRRIIAEQLGVDEDEVTPEASFEDDLNADRIELAEMFTVLEEEFGIEIPGAAIRRMTTVQDALDYLEEVID